MNIRKLTLAMAATSLLGISATAQALTLFPNTLLEDDDAEYQAVDLNQNGLLDVGDTLRGIFDITKIVNQGNTSQNYDPAELTGIFETEVKTKVATATPGLYNFTFGPVGSDLGTIFTFYADGANDYAIGPPACGDIATCEATATGGAVWATFGFTGDADEEWGAFGAPDDTFFFETISSALDVGNFRFALGNIINNTGYELKQVDLTGCGILFACAGDGKVDMIGSGGILGTSDINTPFTATSDTDFVIGVVPSPAPLALVAIGLISAAASMRKKKRA